MARERRPRRGAEAEAPSEDIAVAEPVAESRGGGRDRPAKVPSGPSFALPTAFMAGLVAAVLAFVAVTVIGATAVKNPAHTLDEAGFQAARMLAAGPTDFWRPGFGSSAEVRKKSEDLLNSKLSQIPDKREQEMVKSAFEDWKRGVNRSGKDWRPGLDLLYPAGDPADAGLEAAKKKALDSVQGSAPGAFVGAALLSTDNKLIWGGGKVPGLPKDLKPVATLGATSAYEVNAAEGLLRIYTHPAQNKGGVVDATAYVALRAPGAASLAGAAGAAAAAAFLGAFLVAFLMSMGPVKAMRRLAADTEAVAKGDFSAKVSVGGPDVVQAAARNVQKIAAAAQNAASTAVAVPQIVTQQVVVQPVAEITEGLSPSKGFKRPDDVEIEATQKSCPDVANDYYDVINVDDDNVGLLVADIPNTRGVRGALYMAQVRALFRAVAFGEKSPAEVLKLLNRAFAKELPRGVYVTALYAVYSRSTGIVRVASAQHLPLVIWKASKKASAKLSCEGIALGLDAGAVFDKTIAEKAVQLEKGDRIVLFTDGAIQAKNPGGAVYGEERFYYVLNREAPKNSAACVNFVANDFDLFHEGATQVDDLTVVTMRKMK